MLKRSPFGIDALDRMIDGGVVQGSATVIEGAPGTGKTTLGLHFIINGIEQFDEPGLIVTFEEFPAQYYHDAMNFGWDLRKLEDEGKLKIIFSDPATIASEIDDLGGAIENLIDEMGIKRCLVDSLTHFEYAVDEEDDLREMEFGFISSLKREGVTALLLRENTNLLGDTSSLSQAPFIADNFFILRYVEIDSAISKAILALKMRGSQHAKDIRQFRIGPKGIEIMEKFKGRQGVMSGTPIKTEADAFVEAFSAFGKSGAGKGG
jgi:circadian clock protein KaiC